MTDDGLFMGLMSGTSVDAIDAVVLEWGASPRPCIRATHSTPIPAPLRKQIFALSRGIDDSVHTLCTLDRQLGELFAAAALQTLESADLGTRDVVAIGCHGQTVRHHPPSAGTPAYSLQIGDGNTIAERTGITTVTDFRRRDVAAGGEGAPLVPLFHADLFGHADSRRAIVNIGGIANVTLLDGHGVVAGFDCGPGNTLLDGWIAKTRGEPLDANGAWAAEHAVHEPLLQRLLDDPWFQRQGPRSTGPERFNLSWLEQQLPVAVEPGSVQATLAELTARGIAMSLAGTAVDGVWVCGGGAMNTDLMRRLHRQLLPRDCPLYTTADLGLDAQWVEAAAFAWLARQRLLGRPGSAPAVTGASAPRVLGAIHAGVSDGE